MLHNVFHWLQGTNCAANDSHVPNEGTVSNTHSHTATTFLQLAMFGGAEFYFECIVLYMTIVKAGLAKAHPDYDVTCALRFSGKAICLAITSQD